MAKKEISLPVISDPVIEPTTAIIPNPDPAPLPPTPVKLEPDPTPADILPEKGWGHAAMMAGACVGLLGVLGLGGWWAARNWRKGP